MPSEQEVAAASRALAGGLALIVAFLGLRQWHERRHRGTELGPEDRDHFSRQDRRRWLGIAALALIAVFALIGSRTPSRIAGKGNLLFVAVWAAVMGLLVLLLALAMTDWMATRRYGRRRSKELFRDSIEAIRRDHRSASGRAAGGPSDQPSGTRPPRGPNEP